MAYNRDLLGHYSHDYHNMSPFRPTLSVDIASFNSISGGVVASTLEQLLSNSANLIITPYGLSMLLSSPPPIGDITPNTGAFTTLTATTPIVSSSGGTGHNSYSKGDILVGKCNRLNIVSVGTNGQVLTANSSSSDGVEWQSPSANNALPIGYVNLADPVINLDPNISKGDSVYLITHCYARSQDNLTNIIISNPDVISSNNIVISSSSLGNARVCNNLVHGGCIDTHFIIGDVIRFSINDRWEGRRVIGIATGVLTIDFAFSTNLECPTAYYRGGYAPNTSFYLYCYYDASNQGSGYLLSTRSIASLTYSNTLVDVPGCFSIRQLWPVFFTNKNRLYENCGQFEACTYVYPRITTKWNPCNPSAASLYASTGFSILATPTPQSIRYDTFSQIPVTMTNIYLTIDSSVVVNGEEILYDMMMPNYSLSLMCNNFTDNCSSGRVTFIGGIVNGLLDQQSYG